MKQHWLNRDRLFLYPCAMLAVLSAIGIYWVVLSHHGVAADGNPLGYDFVGFWAAGRLALSGHAAEAYDFAAITRMEVMAVPGAHPHVPWSYPPGFILLLLPFAVLPYFPAYLAFVGGSFAAYVSVLRKTFDRPGALLPLLAFPPVWLNFFGGQNGLLTASLIGGALLLLRNSPVWAGALIGLLTIKPHLGLLIPVALICGGHWRALLSAGVVGAMLLLIAMCALGRGVLSEFVLHLPAVAGWAAANQLPLAKMPTFFSFARLIGMPLPWAYILSAGVTLCVAGAIAWVWIRCKIFALRAALLASGCMLGSPYLFDYDLTWLAVAVAWFSLYALQSGWKPGEREVLVAAWLIPIVMQPLYSLLGVQLAPFVLLLLFIVILRRAQREIVQPPAPVDAVAA